MKRYEISNEDWNRTKDMLPPENTGKKGRPAKDNRNMLNGMLWIARTGAQWRELPEIYGPWQRYIQDYAKGNLMEYLKQYFVLYHRMRTWRTLV